MAKFKVVFIISLFSLVQCITISPSYAEKSADQTQQLLEIIKQQQERLDAQAALLDEQRKMLETLRNDVEILQSEGKIIKQSIVKKDASKIVKVDDKDYQELKQDISKSKEEWPGSISLMGTDTRLKFGGFINLDLIHDNNAVLTPAALVTQAIVTRNATNAQGKDGQTNFSVQASRVQLETRTPIEGHQLKTFTSIDWFDDFYTTKPNMRLREAYGEIDGILFGGDILMGQTWSTYTNMYSYPNVLEFQGPNALLGTRHPMVRWTKSVNEQFKVLLAAEAPDGRNFENASSMTRWPDGVAALLWQTDDYNIQGSILGRDLRGSGNQGDDSVLGWGVSLAGRVHMPDHLKQDFITFSFSYGEGIGGILNDVPPDASYDPLKGELKAIPTFAWFGSYQHWWSPQFYSVAMYGEVKQDTFSFQAPTAYEKTQYGTVNLVWAPVPQWQLGIEAAYGSREDRDNEKGSVVRTLINAKYIF